jgi:hypothetical protein
MFVFEKSPYIDDVVVENEPEAGRFDDGDVVAAVGARPAVDDDGHEVVHPVGVDGVIGLKKWDNVLADHFFKQID